MVSVCDLPVEKLGSVMNVLELAVHPGTDDGEAIGALHCYRRLTKGASLKTICEFLYGGGDDTATDQWAALYAEQTLEITRLRNELRRVNKALSAVRRPTQGNGKEHKPIVVPELVFTDPEWEIAETIIPQIYRNERGRARIGAMVVILRTGCGWRVLDPDGGSKWTTYYNQYRAWQYLDWWTEMMGALNHVQ
jgi:hypothetical protein